MNRTLSIIIRRLGSLLVTLAVMSLIIFMLVEIMPGDVAQMILGQSATDEAVAALREARGLNDPVFQRYFRWVGVFLPETLEIRSICREYRSIRSSGAGLATP